ncbi:MAG: glycosyltransferase [Flavobacteriales bacterium]
MLSQTIVAPRGMLTSGALSIKSRKKRVFIFLAKYLGYYKGVKWHATNPDEIQEIKSRFGAGANVHLAPVLSASAPDKLTNRIKEVNVLRLVTLARISPEKGVREAIEWVCKIPNVCSVSLDVFGAIPDTEYAKKCKELAEASEGRVSIKGEINPNLISQTLGEYHFFILPTKGENFGHAIAESLVNGVPVIISDRTPWKDIMSKNAGWDLPLDKDEFIQAIKQACIMDQKEFDKMVVSAQSIGNELTNSPEIIRANQLLFE